MSLAVPRFSAPFFFLAFVLSSGRDCVGIAEPERCLRCPWLLSLAFVPRSSLAFGDCGGLFGLERYPTLSLVSPYLLLQFSLGLGGDCGRFLGPALVVPRPRHFVFLVCGHAP